jgi:hypothetical protein
MKRLAVLFLLTGAPAPLATRQPPPDPNALSAEEAAGGWTLLFDGVSTRGWRPLNGSCWTVCQGMLAPQAARPGLLMTTRRFQAYQLKLQYLTRTRDLRRPMKLDEDVEPKLLLGCDPEGQGRCLLLPSSAPFPPLASEIPSLFPPNTGWVDLSLNARQEGNALALRWSARWPKVEHLSTETIANASAEGYIALGGSGVVFRGIKIRPL